jgi:hypothetical protein
MRDVTSRFSIISERHGVFQLSRHFDWQIESSVEPADRQPCYVTTFDLGIGAHERMDRHLAAVRDKLLTVQSALESLQEDCKYVLWIHFPYGDFNLSPSLLGAFGLLRVELVFHADESTPA